MVKVYKCYSLLDGNHQPIETYTFEGWGASTKYPDCKYYFSDWKDQVDWLSPERQIFQWLCWIASKMTLPEHAVEVMDFAYDNWHPDKI